MSAATDATGREIRVGDLLRSPHFNWADTAVTKTAHWIGGCWSDEARRSRAIATRYARELIKTMRIDRILGCRPEVRERTNEQLRQLLSDRLGWGLAMEHAGVRR